VLQQGQDLFLNGDVERWWACPAPINEDDQRTGNTTLALPARKFMR
jgi:hypothetical protein